jgi:NitT/TauT family transport system substrate-binding protein
VQDTGIIMFGTNFIEQHRATAQKFMDAYVRALRFYDGSLADGHITGPNADFIYAALAELLKFPNDAVLRDMVASHGNPDGKIDEASLEKDLAFFKSAGDVTGNITPAQMVDSSFVEQALKTLGPYRPNGG